jgi:hypothetical protein
MLQRESVFDGTREGSDHPSVGNSLKAAAPLHEAAAWAQMPLLIQPIIGAIAVRLSNPSAARHHTTHAAKGGRTQPEFRRLVTAQTIPAALTHLAPIVLPHFPLPQIEIKAKEHTLNPPHMMAAAATITNPVDQADSSMFGTLLDSISASDPSIAQKNLRPDTMKQLAAAILERPDRAAAIERLDFSSDSDSKLGQIGAGELAKCLDVLSRLRALNMEGAVPVGVTPNV